jgi:pSer/pThr/pTyr-binding forkhead associated (FHA) protein
VLLAGQCPAGLTFALQGAEQRIGRVGASIPLGEDEHVSPHHATVSQRDGKLVVVDENSLNGILVRIRGPHALQSGDVFRVGSSWFRFDMLSNREEHHSEDGTRHFTSPRRRGSFRVLQILQGGIGGASFSSLTDEVSIGADPAHVVPLVDDPAVSLNHARLYRAPNGHVVLEDFGSTNGTFVRIHGSAALGDSDQLFIGNELFRVEIN